MAYTLLLQPERGLPQDATVGESLPAQQAPLLSLSYYFFSLCIVCSRCCRPVGAAFRVNPKY